MEFDKDEMQISAAIRIVTKNNIRLTEENVKLRYLLKQVIESDSTGLPEGLIHRCKDALKIKIE